MLVSLVIPVYNEIPTLAEILRRCVAVDFPKELVLVDDCSKDGSREFLRQLSEQGLGILGGTPVNRNEVRVLFQEKNQGTGAALRRFIGTPRRVLYYWHSVLNHFLTTLSNMTSGLNLTDMETCYKAFRAEVLRSVTVEEDRFGFEPEITAKVARGGWRVFEVPISYHGRTYEEGKKIGWKDGVRALYAIAKYSLKR